MGNVELDSVIKRFGDIVAVNDVSVTVEEGELLALLGPSGCGKTTTLRMISGLEFPTEGQVHIGGEDVTGVAPQNRDIAMVFQDLALYPHKSVRENMSFGLTMRGYDESVIEKRVEDAAELLEIPELLDRRPTGLSGGQQQRVALGRAIVRDPEVFLLDEPLSSLDAKLRDQMRSEILELHQELEATMVYVTHDQEVAMTLGDRIAVMNDGQIQQVATPAEIYQRPANLFVAQFIGSPDMNFFEATVSAGKDVTLAVDGFDLTITEMVDRDRWRDLDGETVRLGIRPQDIYHPEFLSRNYESGETTTATVELIEELGPVNDTHFSTGSTSFIARLDSNAPVSLGEEIAVVFDTTALHVFDAATGERIPTVDTDQKAPTP